MKYLMESSAPSEELHFHRWKKEIQETIKLAKHLGLRGDGVVTGGWDEAVAIVRSAVMCSSSGKITKSLTHTDPDHDYGIRKVKLPRTRLGNGIRRGNLKPIEEPQSLLSETLERLAEAAAAHRPWPWATEANNVPPPTLWSEALKTLTVHT